MNSTKIVLSSSVSQTVQMIIEQEQEQEAESPTPIITYEEIIQMFTDACLTQQMINSMNVAQLRRIIRGYILTKQFKNNNNNNNSNSKQIIKSNEYNNKKKKNNNDILFCRSVRFSVETQSIIDRMGNNLRLYAISKNRMNPRFVKKKLSLMMDDFAFLKTAIIRKQRKQQQQRNTNTNTHHNDNDDEEEDFEFEFTIYVYLIKTYFNGIECNAGECQSIRNNRRNRMQPTYNSDSDQNQNNDSNNAGGGGVCILDAIHCGLIHGYDTGHKLYMYERIKLKQILMNGHGHNVNNRSTDANIHNNNTGVVVDVEHKTDSADDEITTSSVFDFQASNMRRIVNDRFINNDLDIDAGKHTNAGSVNMSMNMKTKMRIESQKHMASKFVTVLDHDDMDDNKNNSDRHSQSPSSATTAATQNLFYSFGYKFYYWSEFENNTKINKWYNDCEREYRYWFIPIKHASLKQELLNNNNNNSDGHNSGVIPIESYDTQFQTGMAWMQTQYVREITCTVNARDYENVEFGEAISLSHLLSVLFHCNFTAFCTLFSKTFRKRKLENGRESDESLKSRNSEFREFSRLLIESVHVFGTMLYSSGIRIFYHGISIVMHFPSTFAQFCSPTSTTTALTVAINFGERGLVLELENNKSMSMTFFDCSVLSEFSNENERLFIQGGNEYRLSSPASTSLVIKSIRILQDHNYQLYVTGLSYLHRMINGSFAYDTQRLKLKRKHIKCLSRVFQAFTNMNGDRQQTHTQSQANNNNGLIPEYIRQMFDHLIRNTSVIEIFADLVLSAALPLLCEVFQNQMYAFKFDLLFGLFPFANRIVIEYLPLTRKLMDYILNLKLWRQQKQQNDNRGDAAEQAEEEPQKTICITKCNEDRACSDRNDWRRGRGSGLSIYSQCRLEYRMRFEQNGITLFVGAGLYIKKTAAQK